MDSSHEGLIAQFSGITGASPATAQTTLASSDWNLEQAVTLYFASHDDPAEASSDEDVEEQAVPSLPSTTPAANTSSSSSTNRPPPTNPSNMVRTFRDLQNDDDHGDDDHGDQDPQQDFFAGGEKSGLAVQDPNRRPQDHFRNIMQQARENRARPGDEDEDEAAPAQASGAFSGRAQTLGGDDAPSRVIESPHASAAPTNARSAPPRVSRTLHLWQDGFSIDDGPLHRFDDPANAPVLALINQGRAPLALLGVQPGQEVDLQLDPHKDEKYTPPKRQYKPFGGAGQRLGSPTPGPSGSTPAPAAPAVPSTSAASPAASSAPKVDVDESQPTVQLQIRLGDGTRLVSRFNTSHTVGEVYDFVTASSVASQSREFELMTTFPNKALTDMDAKLEDLAELNRGGVVVQKWT
ncbi:SEP-domain-containing protein [Aureobasidium pullulans]|uniref:SEP-domain-containing protein n=1 Tax=Aureobasidium pullulans TaxID=5580 RepID=A0A4S9DMX3_AURPU|nr:SEP-domain-containing protein [Aureobasidium pullulans]THX44402.1 SEP-domain-containing protein [Aureobasidium pullulans]TIA53485.1 SEP-domain-containing protein [Aureobasidium pullulans]